MTTTDTTPPPGASGLLGWPARLRDWLDARGPAAWIVTILVVTVVLWPLGLALAAYALWSRRIMTRTTSSLSSRAGLWRGRAAPFRAGRPTGNHAFDARQAEELDRIEAERQAFEEFRRQRREAEDRDEFDRFMAERAAQSRPADGDA